MPGFYYPFYANNEDDFVTRLHHFISAGAGYVGTFDELTAPVLSGLDAVADFLDFIRANALAAAEYAKGLTQTKRTLFTGPSGGPAAQMPAAPVLTVAAGITAGQLDKLNVLIAQLNANPAMTDTIRADLGILKPAGTPSGATGPLLELLKAQAENVTIKWNKSGHTGTLFQSRLAGTLDWTDLGTDLFSPFVDTRPLAVPGKPETREYRACHIDKEVPTEIWSAVLVVTVSV